MNDFDPVDQDAYTVGALEGYATDWWNEGAFFGPRLMVWAADRIRLLEEDLEQYEQRD